MTTGTESREAPAQRARILFGGSFDPPQMAHRFLIESARARYPDAEIIVIPAGRPPHKLDRALTDDALRLALCNIAFGSLPGVVVSDEELFASDPNYTWMTLDRHRKDLGPEADLYWLLGSDSLLDLPQWREPERILELARILTVPRPGFDVDELDDLTGISDARKQEMREGILPEQAPAIAATEIREALAVGRDCSELLDERVHAFILEQGMYGTVR